MTIGSWTVGPYSSSFVSYNAAKQWSGQDGKTIPGRVSRRSQWNDYSVSHRVSKATKPAPLTIEASDNGTSWTQFTGLNPYTQVVGAQLYEPNLPAVTNDIGGFWLVQDEYELLAKLLKKVKGHTFNVGVALAEVDKFAGGVVGTLKNLGLGVLDLSEGNFGAFARRFGTYPPSPRVQRKLNTRDISGRFLEMRYAWLPAIGDTYSAAQAFEAISNGPRQQLFRVSGKRTSDIYATATFGRYKGVQVVRRSYAYEAYEELGFYRQMGLGNPASILWERIPYSFVVDWFWPIGTYLELIGQVPFLKGRFLRSDSIKQTFSGSPIADANGKWGGWKYVRPPNYAPINSLHFQYCRKKLSSLSVPRPTIRVAGAVQGKRVQNAIALVHQVFVSTAVSFLSKKGTRNSSWADFLANL